MQDTVTRQNVDEIGEVRSIAAKLGASSIEAQVVAEYDRLEAAGENPVCLSHEQNWVLTPFRRYLQGLAATLDEAGRRIAC